MANMTAGVFRCPSCKEFISLEAGSCRFCGVPVNAAQAEDLTRKQTELDNAIGHARTIKLMLPPVLILIPLVGLVLNLFWATVLAVVAEIMCVRWLTTFRNVRTPEVRRLRIHVWLIAFLTIAVLVLFLVVVAGLILLRR